MIDRGEFSAVAVRTVERAIVAAILGLILQDAGRIRCGHAVPKKRWMSSGESARGCSSVSKDSVNV